MSERKVTPIIEGLVKNTQRERENAEVCGNAASSGPCPDDRTPDQARSRPETGVTAGRDPHSFYEWLSASELVARLLESRGGGPSRNMCKAAANRIAIAAATLAGIAESCPDGKTRDMALATLEGIAAITPRTIDIGDNMPEIR